MHAIGVDPLTISTWGRWDSDTYKIYTRASRGRSLDISARMSQAPEDPTLEALFPAFTQPARR